MRIAIIGTRGIPNHYGGFEQFAEYLSKELVGGGHDVWVYNSHNHPYQQKEWNGVNIIHKYDPENKIGTLGQFLYDLLCILDTRKKNFDIILQLGYTSSSVWGFLLPRKSIIVTNMDGLEWKRTKFSKPVQRFLQFAEKLAVKSSDYLVADSIGIQSYLKGKYNVDSTYIAYGANKVNSFREETLSKYALTAASYSMLIARLEPENSIEEILDGVVLAGQIVPFLVIGKHNTKFGEYLKQKYKAYSYIQFLGGIYDIEVLNDLRYYAKLYFHGHTVGGTNPSLLEAMASGAMICAQDNIFNKSILGSDAIYFKDSLDVANILNGNNIFDNEIFKSNNFTKIEQLYSWSCITNQYLKLFIDVKSAEPSSCIS